MKANWSKFTNFLIQFCIVVLGVFFTLWVGNITEKSKEKKKTRQALEMIREELVGYKEYLSEKEKDLKLELELYKSVIDSLPYLSPERLREYKNRFLVFSATNFKNVSIEAAEKTNALGTITDLELIEDLYNVFMMVEMFEDFLSETNTYKWDRIMEHTSYQNVKSFLWDADDLEEISDDDMKNFWNEAVKSKPISSALIHGQLKITMASQTIPVCLELIDYTINRITAYLKDGKKWMNPTIDKTEIPSGTTD